MCVYVCMYAYIYIYIYINMITYQSPSRASEARSQQIASAAHIDRERAGHAASYFIIA